MTISTSLFYDRTTRAMTGLSARAETLQTQISTGKRLIAPSDDSVAYQRLRGLAVADANDTADTGNLKLAASVLQQGDDALAAITDRLQRAQELALSAGSGTKTGAARTAIATELRAILADVIGLANAKDVRGGALFGGATDGDAVTQAADGSLIFQDGAAAAIPIGNGQSVATSVNAGGFLKTDTGDVATVIAALADALDGEAPVDASGAIAGLKSVADQVTQAQASLGARGARVELEQARLATADTAREATRSSIEDTDVTAAITELQKTMTILSATQASFAKLSSLSLFDYLR